MAFGDLRATLAAMNFEMTINQFNRLKDDRYVEARIRKKSRKIYVNGKWSLMRVKFLFVANLQQSNPFYFFFLFRASFLFLSFFFSFIEDRRVSVAVLSRGHFNFSSFYVGPPFDMLSKQVRQLASTCLCSFFLPLRESIGPKIRRGNSPRVLLIPFLCALGALKWSQSRIRFREFRTRE